MHLRVRVLNYNADQNNLALSYLKTTVTLKTKTNYEIAEATLAVTVRSGRAAPLPVRREASLASPNSTPDPRAWGVFRYRACSYLVRSDGAPILCGLVLFLSPLPE
jgi:hypothetical protein